MRLTCTVLIPLLAAALFAPASASAGPALDYAALSAFLQAYRQARDTGQYVNDADLNKDGSINHLDCIRAVEDAFGVKPTVGPEGGTYVWVPPGEFMMGSPGNQGAPDERPQHLVRINGGLWFCEHEVTNAQYAAFLNAHGSINDGNGQRMIYPEVTPWCKVQQVAGAWQPAAGWENHPVVYVTWYGAKAYCDHYGLRLPTEAEWEHAARGALGGTYPWGNAWDQSLCVNWENRGPAYDTSTGPGTMPVGKIPGGESWCGASDMAGNVWEWCADWYSASYYGVSAVDDPTGPMTGDTRLLRGGGWTDGDAGCRSALRSFHFPDGRLYDIGFRVVWTP